MLVTPYGDPQAHGTLSNTLTFIRRRGIVYARPYKVPKDPRSAGQITQRQLFFDAVASWHTLTSGTQAYYNNSAIGQSYTGFNLYVSLYMLGTLPSSTPVSLVSVTAAAIDNIRSTKSDGWRYRLRSSPVATTFGRIYDNANSYVPDSVAPSSTNLAIVINIFTETINIQFKDTLSITLNGSTALTVYLPAIALDNTVYVADDGTTYWDSSYTDLACSPTV